MLFPYDRTLRPLPTRRRPYYDHNLLPPFLLCHDVAYQDETTFGFAEAVESTGHFRDEVFRGEETQINRHGQNDFIEQHQHSLRDAVSLFAFVAQTT